MKKILAKLALIMFISLLWTSLATQTNASPSLPKEAQELIDIAEEVAGEVTRGATETLGRINENLKAEEEQQRLQQAAEAATAAAEAATKKEKAARAAAAKEAADVAQKAKTFLNYAKENPCIKNKGEDSTKAPDKNYIITFIEEPLTFEEEGKTPKDNYVSRICYRNTINYTVGGEVKTDAELSTKCQGLFEEFSAYEMEKYKINISCQAIQVILSKGGTSFLEGYISTIYTWAASIVGIIAVLVIIISGIQISVAGGDTQGIDSAKKRIGKSLLGLVILLLSGLILYTINPTFFVK